jgi:hypothetical protein
LIDGSKNAKELSPHWGVGLEVQPSKFSLDCISGPVNCKIQKIGFNLLVLFLRNPDMGMATAVTHGVTRKADGSPANILDARGLFLEKWMLAMRGKKNEETLKSEISDVGKACLLPPCSGPF